MVEQPMVGGSMAPLPVPILVPVWDMRNGWPQHGAWLGPGRGQEVFGQGPRVPGEATPWQRAGLPSPTCAGAGEGNGVGTGVCEPTGPGHWG